MATRRFERDKKGWRHFWEIELDGATLITRKGRGEGGLIDDQRRTFASANQAEGEVRRRIADRRSAGWREVGDGLTSLLHNHRLEAAIVNDLDDTAAWVVYADWLQARGDPCGEPLALSLAGSLAESHPRPRGLWSIELSQEVEFMEIVPFARLEVRHGFVVRARIDGLHRDWYTHSSERLLGALLRSAASRLLRSLTITAASGAVRFEALLRGSGWPVLEHLRELVLGEPDDDDEPMRSDVRIGDLAHVLRACPNLETLHVRGCAIRFDFAIDHPRLTSLTLETVQLTGNAVDAVVRASLPNLRRLELWLGGQRIEPKTTITHLQPLFEDDRTMVGLRELALVNCGFARTVAQALARSNRLTRLEHVDLSQGTLGERGGRTILEHAAAFRQLRSLDLTSNYLSPGLATALADALPGIVRIGEQIDPAIGRPGGFPGYYAAIGE